MKRKTAQTGYCFRGFAGLLLILFAGACQRTPHVQFSTASVDNPEAGELIRFINETKHATSFLWEFGDGGVSHLTNPEYSYEQAGIYNIKLTAFNGEAESFLTSKISIFEPTQLGFIVFDTSGAPLTSAEVWIYEEKGAWENQEQPLFAGLTNEEGISDFLHLEQITYYLWVFQPGNGGQWYYRGFTPPLVMNEMNWFNVPCVWLPDEPHP
jgi:hypothetical protein